MIEILSQNPSKTIHTIMGCGCNKRENFLISTKETASTERADQIIYKNFGGSRNPIDRKRKIAILKRKQKL